jgi:putative transposase
MGPEGNQSNQPNAQPVRGYATDGTDEEWEELRPFIEKRQRGRGRKRTVNLRSIVNAIFSQLRTGCQWRLLPKDFPPFQTVSGYFHLWRKKGLFITINDALRGTVRVRLEGRKFHPSAGCLDTQSGKTTRVGGPERGVDGGKKIKGRKRHILVDTLGLRVRVVVHAANIYDGEGAKRVLTKTLDRGCKRQKIWADGTYRGALAAWMTQMGLGGVLEIVERPAGQKGFSVLPRRWVIERTFAWTTFNRELVRDYPYTPHSAESWGYLSSIRLMLRRLTGESDDPMASR